MSTSNIIFLIILIVIFFYVVSIYNKLVELKNHYKNGFTQIEIQLKRRYDLIPNLVETAKAYLAHEKGTLEAIIHARNGASDVLKHTSENLNSSELMQQLSQAESMLSNALAKLNVVVEAYPDLKANDTMIQLMEELTSTENRVSFARQGFNDFVTEYNVYRQSFPPIFFASWFGHSTDAQLLTFEDSATIQSAPSVSF